jgi:hypothetical protein
LERVNRIARDQKLTANHEFFLIEEESPYKPEFSCTIFGGHFESENEQKTQQSPAEGFKTSLQLVHL